MQRAILENIFPRGKTSVRDALKSSGEFDDIRELEYTREILRGLTDNNSFLVNIGTSAWRILQACGKDVLSGSFDLLVRDGGIRNNNLPLALKSHLKSALTALAAEGLLPFRYTGTIRLNFHNGGLMKAEVV